MIAADALVAALREGGVDTIFGLPGFQLDSLFDALARDASIRVIGTRHEQATSYMADGYARVGDRPGVCLVVPGPGLLNAATGLATAYACNSPVVCIAGQVEAALIDSGLGLPHEVLHQREVALAVSKRALLAARPDEVAPLTAEALRSARQGRPRPVVLEVPLDVLDAPAGDPAPAAPPASPTAAEPAALERAAGLLAHAERPLIAAGSGILSSGAWTELRALAERLGAPVVMSQNAKGVMPPEHVLTFEARSLPRLLAGADVVLAIGTRFARQLGLRWELRPEQRLVRVDIDPEEVARGVTPAVAVAADARTALRALAALLGERVPAARWSGLEQVHTEERALAESFQPQAAYGRALAAALPEDAILVAGMTQLGYWMRIGHPVRQPRTWLTPGYQATLGFELPTGLGAQVGRPDRRVVVVAGDGGAMFNIQELATAVQHRIPAIVVLFNDNAYGNVRRTQANRFGHVIASELHNPDFLALADAFGVLGLRASTPAELRSALTRALAEAGPVLIEVRVGEMPDPWPVLLRS